MITASVAFADINFSAEVQFSTFTEPTVEHSPAITSVSAIEGILNAKALVNFGACKSATAELVYKTDIDVEFSTTSKGSVLHKSYFYIATEKLNSSAATVDYRIIAACKDAYDNIHYAYWPSSFTYQTANIVSSSSGTVTAASGGTVIFGSGNQQYGNTQIVIYPGTVGSDTKITITQLPLADAVSSVNRASGAQMIAIYNVQSDPDVQLSPSGEATFFYGLETSVTKFELKRRDDDQSEWENITITSVDTTARTVKAKITKMGEYALFASSNLSDNDYRPAKRVKVKTRIEGDGFKFNNLKDGDSVKIYNINGKKIREINSGNSSGFEWDGRKDNGDWAESGTYVYQIKVSEKSKTISGTIAFVW